MVYIVYLLLTRFHEWALDAHAADICVQLLLTGLAPYSTDSLHCCEHKRVIQAAKQWRRHFVLSVRAKTEARVLSVILFYCRAKLVFCKPAMC